MFRPLLRCCNSMRFLQYYHHKKRKMTDIQAASYASSCSRCSALDLSCAASRFDLDTVSSDVFVNSVERTHTLIEFETSLIAASRGSWTRRVSPTEGWLQ